MPKKNTPAPVTNEPAKEVAKEPVKETPKKPATAPKTKKVENKPEPVEEKPVVTETSEASVEPVEDANSGEVIIKGLIEKVGGLGLQIKAIQTTLKQLSKEFDKQKKIIDKVQKKRDKAKKSPSGFAKPCKISDELCDFMGIKKGSEQSRTDITRYINAYVKEHNLNNPENRREFFPDKKLKSILNIKDGEKVTYFVLQRLIAHHFPPSQSKLAAAKA